MQPVFDRLDDEVFASPRAPAPSAEDRTRITTAGRLLVELARDPAVELSYVALRLGVEEGLVEHCRAGHATLPTAAQMRLAALALLIAPQLGRRARALYAQAQAALRIEEGVTEGHMTYPREQYR